MKYSVDTLCAKLNCSNKSHRFWHGTGKYCKEHRVWTPKKTLPFELLKMDGDRKIRLIKESGWKCWECHRRTWCGKPIPLQLDHIDGKSANSSRENLRIVCANCHAQTPTFSGKNMGNTNDTYRLSRRRR